MNQQQRHQQCQCHENQPIIQTQNMKPQWFTLIIVLCLSSVQAIVIPKDPYEGPPIATFYRPPVYPVVPIRIGERRE